MITNDFLRKRIRLYEDVLDCFQYNFSDEAILLLQQDLNMIKKQRSKNPISETTFNIVYKNFRLNYLGYINAFVIIFSYYFSNMNEKIEKETLDEFVSLARFLLFGATIDKKFTVIGLQPININGYSNHTSRYYFNQYYKLLANDDVFDCSDIAHEECYRQICNSILDSLIKHKQSELLIEFYRENNRYFSLKNLLISLVESKIEVKDNFYSIELIEVVLNTYNQIVGIFEVYDELNEKSEEKDELNKENGSFTSLMIIVGKLIDLFENLRKNDNDRKGFAGYIDKIYMNKKISREILNYKIQLISTYLNTICKDSFDLENEYVKLIFGEIEFLYHPKQSRASKVSTSCIDFLEHYIDYLIDTKANNNVLLYSMISLYLKIKEYNLNSLSYDEIQLIKDFVEEIKNKYFELETEKVMKNLYLADKYDDDSKKKILEDFFASAFDNYVVDNTNINCNKEFEVYNINKEDIYKCVSAIYNNRILVDEIVSGEILAKHFIDAAEDLFSIEGDYTNFLTCQIKSVERYMKAILIKYHKDNIYLTEKERVWLIKNGNRKLELVPGERARIKNGIEDKIEIVEGDSEEKLNRLECGPAFYALKYAYKLEGERFPVKIEIGQKWINNVRNGHFHIDRIKTIGELKIKRTKTAFFLMYMIISFGNKGVL